MTLLQLQIMISLIEGEYEPQDRNTSEKMVSLISDEFGIEVSENEILNFYNLGEDYEKLNREIEYENRY